MRTTGKFSRRIVQSYNLYIPHNIDLDQLLEEYPLSIPHAKDYLMYLMHLIHAVPAFRKDSSIEANNGYTVLYSTFLQNRVKQYSILMQWLIERGIVESDNHYVPRSRSKGYRFAPAYRVELRKKITNCYTLIKSILTKRGNTLSILQPEHLPDFDCEVGNSEGLSYSDLAKRKLSYLKKWFNTKFQIDVNFSEQYLTYLLEQDVNNNSIHYPMHKFNCRMMVVNNFNDTNLNFHVDGTAGRLHTPLTNLKSQLRAFLTYDGQTLSSADLRNSQPLLSLTLLNYELLTRNRMLQRISLYNDKFSIGGDSSLSTSSTMLVNFIRDHSQSPDVLLYRDLVLSGRIYEHFEDVLRRDGLVAGEGPALRKLVKKELFTAFFSHNKAVCFENSYGLRAFKSTFPNVYNVFTMIKSEAHSTLACVLQNLEAELVLHGACKDIASLNSEIPLFTIHDSIATTSEHINLVSQKLSERIFAAIDAEPQIKIEIWNDSMLSESVNEMAISGNGTLYNNQYNMYKYVTDEWQPSIDEPLFSMKYVADKLGIGRTTLMKGLRHLGILADCSRGKNRPSDEYINSGYFKWIIGSNKRGPVVYAPKVTPSGLTYLRGLIDQHPELFPRRR